jgi:hypothetical protein
MVYPNPAYVAVSDEDGNEFDQVLFPEHNMLGHLEDVVQQDQLVLEVVQNSLEEI